MISPQDEKIKTFVEDSLDAHEEYLQCQATDESNEQPNRVYVQAEDPREEGEGDKLDKDNEDPSRIKPRVDKESVNLLGSAGAKGSKKVKKLEIEQVIQQENQSGRDQLMMNEAEGEQSRIVKSKSEQCEKKPPPPPEAEKVAHCPGPLVTELEDADQTETIQLPMHKSLHIEDLPDLEDVDTKEFPPMVFSQQVSKPKIEVISGGSDEDEPSRNQKESFTFSPDKILSFSESSNSSSPLLHANDWEALGFIPVGTTKQSPPPQCSLIEELD